MNVSFMLTSPQLITTSSAVPFRFTEQSYVRFASAVGVAGALVAGVILLATTNHSFQLVARCPC